MPAHARTLACTHLLLIRVTSLSRRSSLVLRPSLSSVHTPHRALGTAPLVQTPNAGRSPCTATHPATVRTPTRGSARRRGFLPIPLHPRRLCRRRLRRHRRHRLLEPCCPLLPRCTPVHPPARCLRQAACPGLPPQTNFRHASTAAAARARWIRTVASGASKSPGVSLLCAARSPCTVMPPADAPIQPTGSVRVAGSPPRPLPHPVRPGAHLPSSQRRACWPPQWRARLDRAWPQPGLTRQQHHRPTASRRTFGAESTRRTALERVGPPTRTSAQMRTTTPSTGIRAEERPSAGPRTNTTLLGSQARSRSASFLCVRWRSRLPLW